MTTAFTCYLRPLDYGPGTQSPLLHDISSHYEFIECCVGKGVRARTEGVATVQNISHTD